MHRDLKLGAESSDGTGDDDVELRYCGGDAKGGDDGCGGGSCCWCCGVVTKFKGLNFSRRGVDTSGGTFGSAHSARRLSIKLRTLEN